MDDLDRLIVNELQQGFPICDAPFAEVAAKLHLSEEDLLQKVKRLKEDGVLTRFGPLFNVERMGGALTLAAIAAPVERFDELAERVNAFSEVAHNYARAHHLNMWFVLATEKPDRIPEVIRAIEEATGCEVHNFPKREEFYVGLYFPA